MQGEEEPYTKKLKSDILTESTAQSSGLVTPGVTVTFEGGMTEVRANMLV